MYTLIKREDHGDKVEYRQSTVGNKYKDEFLEVNVYKLIKAASLCIYPTLNSQESKTFIVLYGSCYNAETESVLVPGDIIVMKNSNEYMNLIMLEKTEIIEQGYNVNSFKSVDENITKLLDILDSIQQKDLYTDEHCKRVLNLSTRMALKLSYKGFKLYCLRRAGRYHDIGKLYISDAILSKPDKLNNNEYSEMKNHVNLGKELIEDIFCDEIFSIISQHHERVDGSGYPNGLKGEEISEEGKILAICDSYEAMTTDRVYKKGKSHEEAILELRALAGKLYDERLVEVFIDVLESKYLE